MIKLLMAMILVTILIGCTSSNDANKALRAMGFSDIQMTGYSWFACSNDDFYHTGFIAKNSQGVQIAGTVCLGFFFKNSTVRFY